MNSELPVTRVYRRHYSTYYSTHMSVDAAKCAIREGDGRGLCFTKMIVDEDGNIVFNSNVDGGPLGWTGHYA